jgi:YbbR domain-containing protein
MGPPDGYRVSAYSIQPSKTRIRGPEERVKNIDRVSINPVDLSTVVSQAELHTKVNIGDPQVRLEVPTTVTLKVTLVKTPQRETK